MIQDKPTNKIPSPWLSLLPIAILVALLALTIYIFGSDALGGGSQVSLLIATGVCVSTLTHLSTSHTVLQDFLS